MTLLSYLISRPTVLGLGCCMRKNRSWNPTRYFFHKETLRHCNLGLSAKCPPL